MGRNAAIVTTWGNARPGRELKALEAFMDFMTFIGKQAADDNCTEPEVYFAADGAGGFAITRGNSTILTEILESDQNRKLVTRGHQAVENLKLALYYTGDEEVQALTQLFAQVVSEEGYA